MGWEATQQAATEYARAKRVAPSARSAYDDLLARIYLDPSNEGLELDPKSEPQDQFMRRILQKIVAMKLVPPATSRVSYQTTGNHRTPPPSFAFSIHVASWKPGTHLLLVLGTV